MGTLKQIASALADAADITTEEADAYVSALRKAGLIPRGRLNRDALVRATAWLVLAILTDRDEEVAAQRVQVIADYRAHAAGLLIVTSGDGTTDQHVTVAAPAPGISLHEALVTLLTAQAGKPSPVLPTITVSDGWGVLLRYGEDREAHLDFGDGSRASGLEFTFTPSADIRRGADRAKVTRLSMLGETALAAVTRLLDPVPELIVSAKAA